MHQPHHPYPQVEFLHQMLAWDTQAGGLHTSLRALDPPALHARKDESLRDDHPAAMLTSQLSKYVATRTAVFDVRLPLVRKW